MRVLRFLARVMLILALLLGAALAYFCFSTRRGAPERTDWRRSSDAGRSGCGPHQSGDR